MRMADGMIIIAHRKNTKAELEATPEKYGVEVDIRSQGNVLIVHHNPFAAGEIFSDWLSGYRHQTLILNVKEEGLETRLLEMMDEREIRDFFFLDQSFPFLIRTIATGEKRCAARVSEYESVDTAMSLAGKIDWVWVDCFTTFPLSGDDARRLQEAGFKLCLVSPELLGRFGANEISDINALMVDRRIKMDAVCTKMPEAWELLA